MLYCHKCKKEWLHEYRVYNATSYQAQGFVCQKCDNWRDVKKISYPPDFDKVKRRYIK